MFDTIETTDWTAIPGANVLHDPGAIAAALRALGDAVSLAQAADAASALCYAGLMHEHSGTVHPVAAVAAPILLDIVENGHPGAGAAALSLLDDAMNFGPRQGFEVIDTDYGTDVGLCCAVAQQVRDRRSALARHGREGKLVRITADEHGHEGSTSDG